MSTSEKEYFQDTPERIYEEDSMRLVDQIRAGGGEASWNYFTQRLEVTIRGKKFHFISAAGTWKDGEK